MLVYGAGAALSHLFLPGAGADPIWSETEPAPGPRDFRSRNSSKKWRLRKTGSDMHKNLCKIHHFYVSLSFIVSDKNV